MERWELASWPLTVSEAGLDSLWAALVSYPSLSTHRIDSLDVTGDGVNDVLVTPGCGTAMCVYYTFVREGRDLIYVGHLGTGTSGPFVCEDDSGRVVVTMAYARLYGGHAAVYHVTSDSVQTVAKVPIGPFDPEAPQDVPDDFFTGDCDL